MKKALVIKLFAAGDVLMATPVAEVLANHVEPFEVHWLVGEWSAELLKENPFIHNAHTFPDKIFYDRLLLLSKWRVLRMLQKEKFDVVVALHDHPFVRGFAKAVGAKQMVSLRAKDGLTAVHQSARYYETLSSLGICGDMHEPKIYLTENEQQYALTFFQQHRIPPDSSIIGIAPGGGINPKTTFLLKRWASEKYKELEELLIQRLQTARIFLFGHEGEKELCEDLRCVNPERIVNTAGSLTLREMSACLKFCHVFIGSDSAPAHIAASVSTPAVVLFGPTSPDVWKPCAPPEIPVRVLKENYDCMPCYKDDGNFPSCSFEHRCMKTLTAERVFSVCEEILNRALPRI